MQINTNTLFLAALKMHGHNTTVVQALSNQADLVEIDTIQCIISGNTIAPCMPRDEAVLRRKPELIQRIQDHNYQVSYNGVGWCCVI